MLQLGKCAKDNFKIFLLNRKVSKMSFGDIKLNWKFLGHPYKSENFKLKIQQKNIWQKDAEKHLDIP